MRRFSGRWREQISDVVEARGQVALEYDDGWMCVGKLLPNAKSLLVVFHRLAFLTGVAKHHSDVVETDGQVAWYSATVRFASASFCRIIRSFFQNARASADWPVVSIGDIAEGKGLRRTCGLAGGPHFTGRLSRSATIRASAIRCRQNVHFSITPRTRRVTSGFSDFGAFAPV